ncbi:MAG: AAA family ATPase [Candidatus Krumholzibacteriia bacterium]
MKVLALYSIKGGVGKTAAAVNLAHAAARDGRRTLLLDLDPQGAASFYFRVRPRKKGDVARLLAGGDHLQRAIRATDYPDLDILPAHLSFRRLELALDAIKKPHARVRKLLKPQRRDYDLVVIDCPPTLTLVAESVLRAADLVLVPVVPTVLSQRTLEMLEAEFDEQKLDPARLWAFFSLVDRRKTLHRDLMSTLPQQGATHFCRTCVPASSDIERMGLAREPVACFAAESAGAVAMQDLWNELSTRLS